MNCGGEREIFFFPMNRLRGIGTSKTGLVRTGSEVRRTEGVGVSDRIGGSPAVPPPKGSTLTCQEGKPRGILGSTVFFTEFFCLLTLVCRCARVHGVRGWCHGMGVVQVRGGPLSFCSRILLD